MTITKTLLEGETEYTERKRMNYTRRIRDMLKEHNIAPMSRPRMLKMVDCAIKVQGDALTDPDLLVLARLVHRGLLD